MKTYILDGKTPVLEPDIVKWAQWYESADTVVRSSTFEVKVDGALVQTVEVLTVFWGVLLFERDSFQRLFETRFLKDGSCSTVDWASSWEHAEAIHENALSSLMG